MSTILISIDHINQLIPAVTALRFKHKNQQQGYHVVVLTKPHLYFSPLVLSYLNRLLAVIGNVTLIEGHKLFSKASWVTKIPATLRAQLLLKKLRAQHKGLEFDEFFFAHDISSDFWNQTIMHAFPNAKRICYGDALGLVYSQIYFKQLMYSLNPNNCFSLANLLARAKRKFLYPRKSKQLATQQAILTIPCDPGNDFLSCCELAIPPKNELKQCVTDLANALPEFKTYLSDITAQATPPCYLFALSNFTESKLTTLANEIALYREILTKHTTKNATIIIKPHPAHHAAIFAQIIAALQQDYIIHVIAKEFFSLPIELSENLVHNCHILSVSYSSISIPFIYAKKVTHVLTNTMITKYFIKQKIDWFISNNNLFLKIIAQLPGWDQQSALSIQD